MFRQTILSATLFLMSSGSFASPGPLDAELPSATLSRAQGAVTSPAVANKTATNSTTSTVSANGFAYIAVGNSNGPVNRCVANSDGTLSDCKSTGDGFSYAGAVAINPGKTLAYVSNAGSRISYCHIDPNNGELSGCASSTVTNPVFATINPSNTFAYISNAGSTNNDNGTVSYCRIDSSGALSNCTVTSQAFNHPEGIAISSNGASAYIGESGFNGGRSVVKCEILAGGDFGTCQPESTNLSGKSAYGIALNPNNTVAYVAAEGSGICDIYACPINASGSFDTCNLAVPKTSGANGCAISISSNNTFAYMVSTSGSSASAGTYSCSINQSTGAFTTCNLTGSSAGGGIAVTN